MHDVEESQQTKDRILPWIRSEAAAILFIAIFGALFVHLGFDGISARYGAMGFPPALFPPELVQLQIVGFVYGVRALALLALTPGIGFLGWLLGRTRRFRNIAERVKASRDAQSMYIPFVFFVVLIASAWDLWNPLVRLAFIFIVVFFACAAMAANLTYGKINVVVRLIGVIVLFCIFYVYYLEAGLMVTAMARKTANGRLMQ